MTNSERKAKSGLTLLELTIALSLLMVFLGMILINTSANNNEERILNNAARVLQADLRYAQRRAIMEGKRYGICFKDGDSYHLVTDIVRSSYDTTIRTVELPDGVEASINTSSNFINYLPRGTISGGATVTLTLDKWKQRITLSPSSGRATINEIEEK
ncbi:MAG: GspH/FimT family protein [Defluviitaleaceae bacterium]|nr:GspH/FimT family protein [Defluviitaleaceae bacterium]